MGARADVAAADCGDGAGAKIEGPSSGPSAVPLAMASQASLVSEPLAPTPFQSTSSMMVQARSTDSVASFGSHASLASFSPAMGGIAFDPGVEVMAFKEGSPAGGLR